MATDPFLAVSTVVETGELDPFLAVSTPVEPEAPQRSFSGQIGQGAGNTLDGIAAVLGFPADIVSSAINLTGISALETDDPIGGSKSIKTFFRQLGVPEVDAQNSAERVVGFMVREGAATITFFGAKGFLPHDVYWVFLADLSLGTIFAACACRMFLSCLPTAGPSVARRLPLGGVNMP